MEPRILTHHIAGEGDPLVLLPGGLTGWLSWIPHQRRLSERYRAIRVQPIHNELGSAGTPGDPTYSRAIARESLLLTLEALGIDRAHFAGWSAGGNAAIDFAAAHPERIMSLTLVEPAAYWILDACGEMDGRLRSFVGFLEGLAGRPVSEDDLAAFLAAAGFVPDPAVAREDPYWEQAVPHRTTLSWLSANLMGSDATIEDLRSITSPALVTKGTVTEPWEQRVVDLIGDHLPDARVLELAGHHAHHIQSIDAFIEACEEHLSSAALRNTR